MTLANKDIRDAISRSGILYWQIADRYGITDSNFSRLLRKELPIEKKQRIFSILAELQTERDEHYAENN